ncbi:DUF2147 domain-containing protein [Sphingomonas changnyeongensis]|uniref:DUF2147 domain-containing protein n=1 Tax=Sphingomonas changnyeongensis TaxID=2698679 RepID=A0A7Z2NUR1_9SPHN|nr:DUF2147 domain-containing protein [Sphingomonas changnyeongensis]QHL90188.1 DUF2147 domain-containing protein [Sphingomonas changnyeongensis]
MKAASALAFAAMIILPQHAAAADRSFGTWKNPQNSVHVRAQPCGPHMCGIVVWASAKAKADARKGGTDPLIGSRLFRDFEQEKPGIWRGTVFVPDIGRSFSGTISVIDDNTLIGKGCLVGRVGCRSQQWTRLRD